MLFYIIIYLFIKIVQSNYDELLVKTSLNISQSTYCLNEESKYKNWECITCTKNNIYIDLLSQYNELVVFGYNTDYKQIFISFRGSTNIPNWINNIKFTQIQPYNNTNISVEKGFYNIFKNLKDEVIDTLNNIKLKYKTEKILITGHSLGGALSTLLAFEMLYINNYNVNDIILITFGSPRVGNEEFITLINNYHIYSNRITHYYDIVPHMPQQFLKYNHISQEIWYNEDNSIYTLCNDKNNIEDISCSDSCSPTHCTSTTDHMNYLNISMGEGGLC